MQISKIQINHPPDIHERIYQFVIRTVTMTKAIELNTQNKIIIHQLIRSTTSVGANDQEADGAETRKDFIAKYSIVKKEAKETLYWLRLLADTNPLLKGKLVFLQQEAEELVKIISSIIIKSKRIL